MNNNAEEVSGDSKVISTNQPGIHEKLTEIVNKHLAHPSKKPYQQHTVDAFNAVDALVKDHQGEVILDSCCGVGQSTRILAKNNPQAFVVGIDKSAHRITRNADELAKNTETGNIDNFVLIRADLNDFYRLVAKAKWRIKKHYILYPNPWPKAKHIQRRWHGSAVFPEIISLGDEIILRSNWQLYLQEFQQAAEIAGRKGNINLVVDCQPMTPFEAKYKASGQACWQLAIS